MTAQLVHVLGRVGEQTTTLLRRQLGREVLLVKPQLLKEASRTLVIRYTVEGRGAPFDSVIVKVIRDDAATGFSDWASLAFLAALPGAAGLAPRFLIGDVAQRLFVLEDLGPPHSLHDELTSGTAQGVERSLRRLAAQMARLHCVTVGHEEAFLRLRQQLPAPGVVERRHEAERWMAARGHLLGWFARTGCEPAAGFDACLSSIAVTYADPGPWLSFSHGDPAPSNNQISEGGVWLLDFEYGAFRHALYDISAWNVLCPLPLRYARLMRETFQEALCAGFPSGDALAESFDAAWAALCAYRGLAILTWIPPSVLEDDQPFVGDWTARQAALAALIRAGMALVPVPIFAPLADSLGHLGAALRGRWPAFADRDDIATRWPALEQSSEL